MSVALITGTSTGIGRSTAIELAKNGYRVFASMRDPTAADPEMVSSGKVEVIRLDVNDNLSMESAVAGVLELTGRIDILVNNAGIGIGGSVEETTEKDLRDIMETNFFGAWRMMQLVLPGMRIRGGGHIVNVTSVAGRFVMAFQGPYASSKHALEAASEALAQEVFRYNVRVSIIEPGAIKTPIFDKAMALERPTKSPYVQSFNRLMEVFEKRLQDPSPPELVAVTIRRAIETDQPKLRYLVGEDAELWVAGRAKMSDEEYVTAGGKLSSGEFKNWYEEKFRMEL